MSKDSCELYPEVNGEYSRLYIDLLKKHKVPRPVANWIYANYLASNMESQMEAAGYTKKDKLGQNRAEDVLQFIDYASMENEMKSLKDLEEGAGFIDTNGVRIDFTDAEKALSEADKFNEKYSGLVANVYKYGDVYNVIVSEKTSRTHTQPQQVKERLQVWEVYKQYFMSKGLDLENTPIPQEIQDTFSAYNIDLANTLANLQRTDPRHFSKKEFLQVFFLSINSPQVQNLVGSGAFSSIEEAAQAAYDIIHGAGSYTPRQGARLNAALQESMRFRGHDFNALRTQVQQMSQQVKAATPEIEQIKNELHKLNKQFGIDINEVHKMDNKIRSLSQAVSTAIFNLQRQIRELTAQDRTSQEAKALIGVVDDLMRELEGEKYAQGMVRFLQRAEAQIKEIDTLLSKTYTGTELEKAMEQAKDLKAADDIISRYETLINAMASENFVIDGKIAKATMDGLKSTAKDLKDYLDKKRGVVETKTKTTMLNLMRQTVGNKTPDGKVISNAVEMAAEDSSQLDRFLYSMGRASNPVVAAMGQILETAQRSRVDKMNAFDTRIKRATKKLYDAGYDSKFMYDNDGYIISDIDWEKFYKERAAQKAYLKKQGLEGFDFLEALAKWEESRMEDRIVDRNNGRTERVPNAKYRKKFPKLSTAQQEYYDTMMQIKGEIGSMLPDYARHHYLPPQIRRTGMDAFAEARSVKDGLRAIKNKVQNIWTVREDDEDYAQNGEVVVDGETYGVMDSADDNTPLRKIPIFHINKLKDQKELLREFSSGLTALAGQAVHYEAINSIQETVEFMGNFVKNQESKPPKSKADVVKRGKFRVVQDLINWSSNSNTKSMVEGFISQFIYGEKRKGSSRWNKFVSNLIQYTSFKNLSTNIFGMTNNVVMAEFQMMIEAGAGEFYGLKNYLKAHRRIFGRAGAAGEIWDTVMETKVTKASLFIAMFDPQQESFSSQSHTRYHKNLLRKILSHDLSFIGYSGGEFLVHLVNMYAILDHEQVLLNGKKVSLYEAFEVVNNKDGAAELQLKSGVTDLKGNPLSEEWIDEVKRKVTYVNESTQGAMSEEKKGLIYQYWLGRMGMNFRQWMVEHYSRRFRGAHHDSTLKQVREGYYVSVRKLLFNDEANDAWREGSKLSALGMFMKDLIKFDLRIQAQWDNLDDMQKYNCRRARTEMVILGCLCMMSLLMGEPDDHKREWGWRFVMYQIRRAIGETKASIPWIDMPNQFAKILQSPIPCMNTWQAVNYMFNGLFNGDLTARLKSGPNKGEIKYWRNVKKYVLPFYKDYERLQNFGDDDAMFKVFESTPYK